MSDFIVRFQGIELSKEQEHHLQAAIQKTVLTELSSASLAAYTPNPDDPDSKLPLPGHVAYFPRRWWLGIWLLTARGLADNPGVLENSGLLVGEREIKGQEFGR